jgi:hypothetical protein
MGWQWKRWCGQGHEIGIRGFQGTRGQPLTMEKTEISRKGDNPIFCGRLAIIKSDPTAYCVDHTIHTIHAS